MNPLEQPPTFDSEETVRDLSRQLIEARERGETLEDREAIEDNIRNIAQNSGISDERLLEIWSEEEASVRERRGEEKKSA